MKLTEFERQRLLWLTTAPFDSSLLKEGVLEGLARRGLVDREPGPSYPGAPSGVFYYSINDAGRAAVRPEQLRKVAALIRRELLILTDGERVEVMGNVCICRDCGRDTVRCSCTRDD